MHYRWFFFWFYFNIFYFSGLFSLIRKGWQKNALNHLGNDKYGNVALLAICPAKWCNHLIHFRNSILEICKNQIYMEILQCIFLQFNLPLCFGLHWSNQLIMITIVIIRFHHYTFDYFNRHTNFFFWYVNWKKVFGVKKRNAYPFGKKKNNNKVGNFIWNNSGLVHYLKWKFKLKFFFKKKIK